MNKQELIEKFLELTEYTYFAGIESMLKLKLPKNIRKDEFGNFYTKIGDSKTMFTCHLDVITDKKEKVNHIFFKKDNHQFVKTDETTILGGDDKAGVVILLNMIEHQIPGLYYFFIGEEVGTYGSNGISKIKPNYFKNYDRCIAFDRRGYGSIINRQMNKYCCSQDFVNALSQEFSKSHMEFKADPYAVWTDSALFMGLIPECTNISVGYFNEHKKTEEQDLDYMVELANAVLKINWESLPISRICSSHDTPEPKNIIRKTTDKPIKKLYEIFYKLDEFIYEITHMFTANGNFFKPEKEMIFFGVNDINNEHSFSMWVHMDGTLTFKKNNVTIQVENIEILKQINKNKLKKIFKFKHDYILDKNYLESNNIVKNFDDFKNNSDE
jgi:hypothetical protein